MQSDQLAFLIFADLLGIWLGAALFNVVIVMPATIKAGPSGIGFLEALARRHGTGPFYAVFAFVTVITGVWMYFANGVYGSATAGNIWTTLSIGLTILTLLLGASLNRIAESKWVNVAKNTRECTTMNQESEVAAALAKAAKLNIVTTVVLGLALVCLFLSRMSG